MHSIGPNMNKTFGSIVTFTSCSCSQGYIKYDINVDVKFSAHGTFLEEPSSSNCL